MGVLSRRKKHDDEMLGMTPLLEIMDEIQIFYEDDPEIFTMEQAERAASALQNISVNVFMGKKDDEVIASAIDILRGPFRDRIVVLP